MNENKNKRIDLLCYLFIVFLTGCVVGWIYEEFFYRITEGMFRNRGVLYGPWLPIYGLGALGIYAMKPFKKNPVILFLLCSVITAVVEYIIGFIAIRFFNLRLWDYRGLFLNVNGIICFRSVISFAILGMVFHYLIEPAAEHMIKRINNIAVYCSCGVLALLFLADCILSVLFRTPITY